MSVAQQPVRVSRAPKLLGTVQTYVDASFEAAHRLPEPYGNTYMHGHSYRVRVYFDQGRSVEEYARWVRATVQCLDHSVLNDLHYLKGLDPTMENLAMWIGNHVTQAQRVRVWRPTLGCGAEWSRQ